MWEDADASSTDGAAETEFGGLFVGGGIGDAGGLAVGERKGHELGDADDVVAVGVGGCVGLGGVEDGVAEDLGDAFAGFVVPGGEFAEGGAAAVYS